jgi:hypothetical protein
MHYDQIMGMARSGNQSALSQRSEAMQLMKPGIAYQLAWSAESQHM